MEAVSEEEEERLIRKETGMSRTNKPFGGVINDLKRKVPWYISDLQDGVSTRSIASICFLYFACLGHIITFGGILGMVTGNNLATIESLFSAVICGIIYGLFAGQPLVILGPSGPLLVFESIVYLYCSNMGWNYLELRLWIGLWIAGILLFLVAVDAAAFISCITRFTHEIFLTLTAVIFIVETVRKVSSITPVDTHDYSEEQHCNCILSGNPASSEPSKYNSTIEVDIHHCLLLNGTLVGHGCQEVITLHPDDVFIISIGLFLGTLLITALLKLFKRVPFLPNWWKSFISDFAVIFAIVCMVIVDYVVGTYTSKLSIPSAFKPTNPDRGWVIAAFAHTNPWWTPIAACLPGLLGCTLIFTEQQITSAVINRKDHKLKKGGGYHLDMLVLVLLIIITSILGLPWCVANIILSISHVNSLKNYRFSAIQSQNLQFWGVRENRVSSVIIFLMIGISIFISPFIKIFPMPVLFGVFLYMGISALQDIQFFQRIFIMCLCAKCRPDYAYLRDIPRKKVHGFTIIQLVCLAGLWVIKSFRQTSILFPVMVVVLIGVRKLMAYRCCTKRELKILDDSLPELQRSQQFQELQEMETNDAKYSYRIK